MQALRFPSVKRDCRLIFMFFRCETDCSHAFVEPEIVSTLIPQNLVVPFIGKTSRLTLHCVSPTAYLAIMLNWDKSGSHPKPEKRIVLHLCPTLVLLRFDLPS